MQITFITYLIVCPLIFLAGLIDSIAGGGGLISLPIYLAVGLPPATAAGTNKFSAAFGTTFSAINYFKSGNTHVKVAIVSALFAFIGSNLGARFAIMLGESLKYVILGVIPFVALSSFLKLDESNDLLEGSKLFVWAGLIGFVVGMYDGLVGPGTGTFLIILYTAFCGYNLKEASGNSKVVNLSSNVSALIVFMLNGQVLYRLAIPAALFGIAGNYIGSTLAIKNGRKIIRPVLYLVLASIIAKIIYDIIIN